MGLISGFLKVNGQGLPPKYGFVTVAAQSSER